MIDAICLAIEVAAAMDTAVHTARLWGPPVIAIATVRAWLVLRPAGRHRNPTARKDTP